MDYMYKVSRGRGSTRAQQGRSYAIRMRTRIVMAVIVLLTFSNLTNSQTATPQDTLNDNLLEAAGFGFSAQIGSLLTLGADPNARFPKGKPQAGWTPIMVYAYDPPFRERCWSD